MFVGVVVLGLVAALPAPGASEPNSTGVPTQMVITVQPSHAGGSIPQDLQARDVTVLEGNTRVPVLGVERLAGERAEMQLFVLLDDSTRSSSLGIQLPELKTFVQSLPASAQVAVGYMHNGTFALAQAFTADHQKTAAALRLPAAIPGENGSPYFALSDLVKHWPSKEPTGRRAVLMLTDGVDRYYSGAIVDDPYVDAAIQDASKSGVTVSAIYLRGAGFYSRRDWPTTIAQSRLQQVTDETGGYAYFEGITDPVSITPFLNDFRDRLDHQYQLTFAALPHGMQPVKLKTEMPGIKIEGPTRVYVR
jgi:hypothetical protein